MPSGRSGHVAAWSDTADGMYMHGGSTPGFGLGPREVRLVWDGDLRVLGRVVVLQPPGRGSFLESLT